MVEAKIGEQLVVIGYEGYVPEGKRFVCWNTKQDGTGINYNPGQRIRMTSNVRLYPVWVNEE